MAAYDVVIRNGQVADGTGKKLFAADVALKGDRIAAVEAPGTLRGDNEIDAKGKVVAPGFIDVHTHDDRACLADQTAKVRGMFVHPAQVAEVVRRHPEVVLCDVGAEHEELRVRDQEVQRDPDVQQPDPGVLRPCLPPLA